MLASPNSSVSWKRRTNSSPRKITARNPSADGNPSRVIEPAQPIKVRKSQIRAQDPTAPVANQFAETVKRSASYLLKSIGLKRPELKGALNRVYASFFTEFNSWMLSAGRTSQRKLNDPPPSLGLLEGRVTQCGDMIVPLMNELHAWSHVNPELDFEVTEERADGDKGSCACDVSVEPINETLQMCDKISLTGQQKRNSLRKLEASLRELELELRSKMQEDFSQQMRLAELLASACT